MTSVTKFGNVGRVSPDVQAYVNSQIAAAVQPLVTGIGPSITNGNTLFTDTSGKKVKCAPYTMPNTLGVAGEVLTVDAGGNIVYGSNSGPNPFDQDLNTFNDVSFNSVTTANITGPTTVKVAGNDRIVVDSTDTNLFSQNIFTGPSGSYIRLKNNDTFEIGTRNANNGAIECNPNSMAIVGRQARSAVVLTDTTITTSLAFGSSRIDREIMTVNDQEFRDGSGANRLKVSISDGVTINNAFSLPTTTGSVGDILTRTGTSATTWSAPAAAPTFLPTLTVTNLSQGPSDLVQNYTFPNYAPLADQVITSSGIYVMDLSGTPQRRAQFTLGTNTSGVIDFFIPFSNEASPIEDLLNTMNVEIRRIASAANCVAEIIIGYNSLTNTFNFTLSPNTTPSNFTFFRWVTADNPTNYNDLFGVQPLLPGPVLLLPSATPTNMPLPAVGVSLSANCVWRSLANVPFSSIQSDSGSSSIQCEDVGIGQNGIISYGNYNINNGSINNCGNINALDNCNITTNTTQISNGLGEIKLTADSVDRVIIDDTTTTLNSKNGTTGPTGSYLNLNNDSSFSLGSYFANNGAIDCTTNSLALVGPLAQSAVVLTDLNIITSLGVGGRIDREILDTTSQSFRDPTGTERLKIDSTDVTINGAYTLPTTAGVDGEVLTRTTGSATTWNRPQIYSIFSQIVDQTVVNTAIEATIIGGGTPTSTLTVAPNFFTPGMTFRYTTGGLFRTSANNISARFRLRNSGVLFDSGLLIFSNRVILDTPWNVDATFAYMGGTVMVTNFNFQYNAGNDARGFTSQQSNNTFNATVSNTLNFTIQWGVQSINNSITTNFGVIQKIY